MNFWVQHNLKWCVTEMFSAKLNTLRLRESERAIENMMWSTRLYLCATVVLNV